MGGKAPKNQKVPYHILQGMRKKQERRQERREEVEKASGIITGAMPRKVLARGSRARAMVQPAKAGRSGDFGPAPSAGGVKSGVLHLSKSRLPGSGKAKAHK
ncbi:unnamed protein product [Phaeothamnion confervicola]